MLSSHGNSVGISLGVPVIEELFYFIYPLNFLDFLGNEGCSLGRVFSNFMLPQVEVFSLLQIHSNDNKPLSWTKQAWTKEFVSTLSIVRELCS